MSRELIDRSADLKRLRDEGYEIEIINGFALVHSIPYVTSNCEIKYGTLISSLNLAGDKTSRPDTHVINFLGEHPCNRDGSIIEGIKHCTCNVELADGVKSNHSFSNKPSNGYDNYYEKFKRYIEIIMAPAYSIDESVTVKTFKVITESGESIFNYCDTNSSRANIYTITSKLANQKIGIVGLGGTGSYILDLISKTPVAEIHIYDGDTFLQHNAFRSPGAPSIEKLKEQPKKTDYLYEIYRNMHKKIISHNEYIDESNIQSLLVTDFVFVCIDKGKIKREITDLLLENKIPFIDVGIGVEVVDNSLIGSVRVTTCTPRKMGHIANRISFADGGEDEYSSNIQIADLNALNATLAVIKWKKISGFYQDLNMEHNTIYNINDGELINDDKQD